MTPDDGARYAEALRGANTMRRRAWRGRPHQRLHLDQWIISPQCPECVEFLTHAERKAMRWAQYQSPGRLTSISMTLLMLMAKDGIG